MKARREGHWQYTTLFHGLNGRQVNLTYFFMGSSVCSETNGVNSNHMSPNCSAPYPECTGTVVTPANIKISQSHKRWHQPTTLAHWQCNSHQPSVDCNSLNIPVQITNLLLRYLMRWSWIKMVSIWQTFFPMNFIERNYIYFDVYFTGVQMAISQYCIG